MAGSGIAKVFVDVEAHRYAADIIKRHSSNKRDIRDMALTGLDLRSCRRILDVGCGFGFFTEGIRGKVHPDAMATGIDQIGNYRSHFLDACRQAGIRGRFYPSGASLVRSLPPGSFDLVLCSYALYFFPHIIPFLSRVLREGGILIAITHKEENMRELIGAVKDILPRMKAKRNSRLPVEKLIARFSSENGGDLLSPWFGRVAVKDYKNSLVFHTGNISEAVEYFRFKSPSFLAGTTYETEPTAALLAAHLRHAVTAEKRFIMTKDDRIFICSDPLGGGKGS